MELGLYLGRRASLISSGENLTWQLVLDGGLGHRLEKDFEPQRPTEFEIQQALQTMSDQLDSKD